MDRIVEGLTRYPPVSALVVLGLGLVPVLGLLSGALLGLIVLLKGYTRSLIVLAGATAGLALLGWGTGQGALHVLWDPLAGPLVGVWLPTLLLAWVLRSGRSLTLALTVAGALGCLAVIGQLVLITDPVGLWHGLLGTWLAPLKAMEGQSAEDWKRNLTAMARLMPGMSAAGAMVCVSAMLLLARYFQARLVRPGAFGEEFRRLSLGLTVSVIGSLVFVVNLLIGGPVLNNVAIVVLGLFLFQGLAVIHALRHRRNWPRWGLALFYVFLALFTLWVMGLVSGAGLVDNWFDFRRLRKSPES